MSTAVLMPKLGESVVEGTVARWLKGVGEPVVKLEPLLEISTDKIDTEIPAPASGTLLEIVVAAGATVQAGSILARIGNPADLDADSQARGVEPEATAAGHTSGMPSLPPPAPPQTRGADPKPTSGRDYISPVVKRIAAEHAIDLNQVRGTGQAGRITRQDLLAHIAQTPAPAVAPPLDALPTPAAPPLPSQPVTADEVLHPLSAMRRAIAQHMSQSVATSPHVTTVFEIDMTAIARHRERHKAEYAQRGLKLTFTPYFVAAVAAALRHHPLANSRFAEDAIVEQRRIHIGVAVALPNGLLVPVVRDADELTLPGLARAVADLAERARSGGLSPDDLRGGTFTITNHGVGGSLIGTPIINQPQAAILGIGAIVKRPVVVSLNQAAASVLPGPDDAIVIRPMCYLSLSFDHRILDGATADAFVSTIKAQLEAWNE